MGVTREIRKPRVLDEDMEDKETLQTPMTISVVKREAPTLQMDSGCRAWLVCFASFWTNGTIFGIINSVGVLFVNLQSKYPDVGNVVIATIGSLCIGITFLLSPVAGVLVDRFGVRKIALVGSIIATTAMFISSFVDSIVLYYLTFGISLGTGFSLAYTPSLVILGHYFKRRIGLVNGIVTFGSSLFTVVFPFMLQFLFKSIGMQYTFQLLALMLASLIGCSMLFRAQLPFEKPPEAAASTQYHVSWIDKCQHFCTKIVNVKLWKNRKYRIWALTIPVALFGYFVPYMYLVAFFQENPLPSLFIEEYIGKSKELLVSCMGITSGIGRIVFGRLADFPSINRIFLQQLSFFCIGILTIIVPYAHYYEALIILCLGLGLFDGCFISLLGPIAIDLTGRQGASQAIGFLLGLCSIPLTLGPPIAGAIRDWTGSYDAAFIYAGIPPIVGSFLMILVSKVQGEMIIDKVSVPTPEFQPHLDESTCLTSENELPMNKNLQWDTQFSSVTKSSDPRNESTVIIEPRTEQH